MEGTTRCGTVHGEPYGQIVTNGTSWASSLAARAVMRGNRGRDTAPEFAVRRELHRRGLRYRVNFRPVSGLRRTVDIAFTRRRVVVLIDGCYWHGCPEHYRPARTNAEFWAAKVAANRSRDADTSAALEAAGWTVLRFWEHEAPVQVADVIEAAVRGV